MGIVSGKTKAVRRRGAQGSSVRYEFGVSAEKARASADTLALAELLFPRHDGDPTGLMTVLDKLTSHFENETSNLSYSEKIALVVQFARILIDSLEPPPPVVIESAPELWADRDLMKREDPVDFYRRVYGSFGTIGRAQLRNCDPDLLQRIERHNLRHPEKAVRLRSLRDHRSGIIEHFYKVISPRDVLHLRSLVQPKL